MLEVKNLFCSIGNKEILGGVNLEVNSGEIQVIMGPNGSGKSTLASVLSGRPGVVVTSGSLVLDGIDITNENPSKRSLHGLFTAFQHPLEISGVSLENALRLAYNNRASQKLTPVKFRKLCLEKAKNLGLSEEFIERDVNYGASGGEKKKSEILQMLMLSPKYAILDEIDSGLDVDALKKVFASIKENKDVGIIVITHYSRVLKHINPDIVHILIGGKIVKSGSANLISEIETSGYEKYKF
jgi:Fe-S cluster assembly ATP-binding protein